MEKLILNDGTELENSHVLLSGTTLWFYLNGVTFNEAYELMSDPEKTGKIIAEYYGSVAEYDSYTDLFCLRREDDGMVSGGLKHA